VDTDNTLPDPNDNHGDAEAQAKEDNNTELLVFFVKAETIYPPQSPSKCFIHIQDQEHKKHKVYE